MQPAASNEIKCFRQGNGCVRTCQQHPLKLAQRGGGVHALIMSSMWERLTGIYESIVSSYETFAVFLNREPWLTIRRVLWIVSAGWVLATTYVLAAVGMVLSIGAPAAVPSRRCMHVHLSDRHHLTTSTKTLDQYSDSGWAVCSVHTVRPDSPSVRVVRFINSSKQFPLRPLPPHPPPPPPPPPNSTAILLVSPSQTKVVDPTACSGRPAGSRWTW